MKLLVTGNIGYITTEFIKEAFPECQILLLERLAKVRSSQRDIGTSKATRREGFEIIF